MTDPIPDDRASFARWCEDRAIRIVAVGGADTHGMWRGKRMPVADFLNGLDRGVAISDVIFVLTHEERADEGEELIEPPGGAAYPGYFPRKEHGFPDVFVRADLSTARVLPWHAGTVGVTGDFLLASGEPVPIGPRRILSSVNARARELGYQARVALEYEFYIFRGDLRALRDSGYRLDPLRVRPYMYSVYGGSLEEDLIGDLRQAMAEAGVRIEASSPETGPGQYELNIAHEEAVRAADDGFVFKNGVKEMLAARGLMGSFMAKPSTGWAGSSCHLHQSLWDPDEGRNAFFDQDDGPGLSEVGRYYVGGLLATMREFAALFWPTPNSYKRNIPYSWAGTTASWGIDNRTTGLRVIVDGEPAARVEHRVPGADANPYIAVAASVAGGLHGVESKIEPGEAFAGDAYASAVRFTPLPATLEEALDELERSRLAREWFGEDFVGHYVAVKRHEADVYGRQVSDWEVRRYIELA